MGKITKAIDSIVKSVVNTVANVSTGRSLLDQDASVISDQQDQLKKNKADAANMLKHKSDDMRDLITYTKNTENTVTAEALQSASIGEWESSTLNLQQLQAMKEFVINYQQQFEREQKTLNNLNDTIFDIQRKLSLYTKQTDLVYQLTDAKKKRLSQLQFTLVILVIVFGLVLLHYILFTPMKF